MSFGVYFGKYTKRKNSTAKPSFTGDPIACELKQGTSIKRPVFRISTASTINTANYAYCPTWGIYYYVEDISIVMGNIWEVTCTMDTLATYRDEILDNTVYVLRSASNYNGDVIDNYYPVTAGLTTVKNTYKPALYGGEDLSWSNGWFLVGIIGGRASESGAVSYYAFTHEQFVSLCNWLFAENNTAIASITDFSEEAAKVLYNPIQYIASVMWFPLPRIGSTKVSSIPFGWWEAPVEAYAVSLTPSYPSLTLNLTQHPQSGSRGRFLNLSPFTERVLSYWPYGEIEIKNVFPSATTLSMREIRDYVSGKGRIMIWAGDEVGTPVAVAEAQIGVPVSLAQITTDQVGGIISGADKLAGIDLLNPVTWITGAVSGIASYAEKAAPNVTKIGSDGGIGDLLQTNKTGLITLTEYFHTVADDSVATAGRPLCKPVKLSELSGFVLCDCTGIYCPCSDEENDEIVNYLNTGMYII